MFKAAAAVLTVSDMPASLAYYSDTLGFSIDFKYGEPAMYACLCRDDVAVHLLASSATKRAAGQGGVCIFVGDVDGVHSEIAAKGARVVKPPANYDYGMREFDVLDLDGNQLTFGMPAPSPEHRTIL